MSLISQIASGQFKRIIVLTGAGISTSADIPDYRSKAGIFARLMKEFSEATSPQDMFSRSFVSKYKVYEHPIYKHPIYKQLVQDINNAVPTPAHMLCKWFYDKGWLARVYTQNIDGLHQKAGLPDDMVIEYHGSLVHNNVVLYGDAIPPHAILQTTIDFVYSKDPIDLMLVMGTSLQVAPFCALPNLVPKSCTRILVDIHPENTFVNDWSYKKVNPEGMYQFSIMTSSTMKFGKRKVSLRPQWKRHSKWKSQYIVKSDTDGWSREVMSFALK
ncbi:Sir2 family protein [uncultured virus]|nr:Sir2 family protein [uncultured virus]